MAPVSPFVQGQNEIITLALHRNVTYFFLSMHPIVTLLKASCVPSNMIKCLESRRRCNITIAIVPFMHSIGSLRF